MLDFESNLDILRAGAHVEVGVLNASTSTGIEVKDGDSAEGSTALSFGEADVLEGRLLAGGEANAKLNRRLV